VFEPLLPALQADRRIQYAIAVGSRARGTGRADSDLDLAIGVAQPLTTLELGELVSHLESACGHDVDLVVPDEAPPALAYRVFREGVTLLERDREALVRRKARAVLEYLDFKPFEDIVVRGALAAAKRGR
jgi:predicted nucleotidyltransferase